ncbi:hypothetical protein [Bifidobacterium cuniculi]|uniref:Leucine rich repeat variant domain-containing protein n=1 Tax=Bifidobacterium cuniculi TaxID=1688 RepID=A0A087B532_9BIFI|nr:hypothetical protein [Bifidobacterium cuniculi]KFI66132.1 hypothetical protein BCUN_0638 [Bifidobacterium cuniculi]
MVDYDQAVNIIQDPEADPVLLAKVAYENPEFGANVAAHQRAYPGLLRWIAEFGDERARQTAAQLGYEAPAGVVVDRYVEDGVAQPRDAAARDAYQPGGESAQVADAQPAYQSYEAQRASQSPYGEQPVAVQSIYTTQQPASYEPQTQEADDVDLLHAQFQVTGTQTEQPSYGTQQPEQAADPSYLHIQPTNPYGFTAQEAATTTDPTRMQQIAQYAPELHPALAANPYLYQALLDWLSQLGEPATLEVLRTRQ